MDLQEAFNIGVNGVINQGKASVDENLKCMYRGPGGLKCAVGHIIPDDKYVATMEGKRVSALVVGMPFVLHHFACLEFNEGPVLSGKVLNALQSAHDDIAGFPEDAFIDEFTIRAKAVADYYDLQLVIGA